MERNFKLVETDTHQVLLEREYDQETNSWSLIFTTYIEGIRASQTIGPGYTEENARLDFKEFDEEKAGLFVNSLGQLFIES